MTKRDYLLVGFRLFGVFLLVQLVLAAATASGQFVIWYNAAELAASSIEEVRETGEQLRITAKLKAMGAGARVLVYAAASSYFLFGGRRLLALVSRSLEAPTTGRPESAA